MKSPENLLELKSSEDKNRTSNTNRNSTDNTNRIMGATPSGVAHLRNPRCRCAETLGASHAVAATTQGEGASMTSAPSSCDGRTVGSDMPLSDQGRLAQGGNCIGLAIRKGQDEGRISRRGHNGRGEVVRGPYNLASPSDFHGSSRQSVTETYAMTDGVTDADFDSAIEEAKAEGNLSRANTSCRGRGVPARRLLEGRHRGTNSRVLVGRERVRGGRHCPA